MNGTTALPARRAGGRLLDEASGLGIAGQERGDVVSQGVVGAAYGRQKGIALTGRHLECGKEQLLSCVSRRPDRRCP